MHRMNPEYVDDTLSLYAALLRQEPDQEDDDEEDFDNAHNDGYSEQRSTLIKGRSDWLEALSGPDQRNRHDVSYLAQTLPARRVILNYLLSVQTEPRRLNRSSYL